MKKCGKMLCQNMGLTGCGHVNDDSVVIFTPFDPAAYPHYEGSPVGSVAPDSSFVHINLGYKTNEGSIVKCVLKRSLHGCRSLHANDRVAGAIVRRIEQCGNCMHGCTYRCCHCVRWVSAWSTILKICIRIGEKITPKIGVEHKCKRVGQ